ncbi:Gfo/Idh/MocA family protein [Limnoglobus roseus]|uniref:Putative Rossmann-fold-type glycoside hydrolase n=1 Tax=Limnoglobus roseus TaxID=2598579 RepID=A0A5C1AHB8_9BACT|nr:Gfo/Idh/MocA family oxidoreductase [Limnoglobus roseus]QEL18819.1 putative Rossmann-fold-type glycoside hydrolase [Limnoglobus roseus]
MLNRRRFLAATGGALLAPNVSADTGKLRIAVIGVSNRGAANLKGVEKENIVALCDVDPGNAVKAQQQFPKAEVFTDYRKLFDRANGFDAVVISTPDHTHAHATLTALKLGKHVYCEKPLCHTVQEVRAVRNAVRGTKLVTQMGTQIHAEENYRRVVEIVQGGVLGTVNRVHVWISSKPVAGKKTGTKPSAKFDLDVWLGPAPVEFFEAKMAQANYAWPHFHWRWWWEFGGGTLADLGCHYTDLPFWALDLKAPTKVKAVGKKTYDGDNTTPDVMQVDYQFPGVHLTWYHGTSGPSLDGSVKFPGYGAGVLFEGDKGKLVADYSKHQLLPEEFARVTKKPTPTISKSVGHHQEWIDAIKNGGPTTCNFEYSGRLTEAILLGNVAYRCGEELEWDAATANVTNTKNAAAFLGREYRKGWQV